MFALPRPVRAMVPLGVAVAAYPLLPSGLVRDLGYLAIALIAAGVAARALARQGSVRGRGWLLVLGGYAGWLVGRGLATLDAHGIVTVGTAATDAVRLAAYAVLAAGLALMVPRRRGRWDTLPLLDASILASGLAVAAVAFVVAPIVRDPGLSVSQTLTQGAYPLADVLVLGLLARLWLGPAAQSAASWLLTGAVLLSVLGDVLHDYRTVVHPPTGSAVVEAVVWLAAYVLLVGAARVAPVPEPPEPAPGDVEVVPTRRRLLAVALGLTVPPVVLLVEGRWSGHRLDWPVVAIGSLAIVLLVSARLAGLLERGQGLRLRLAALARTDALTGIANRTTWDFELGRAAASARKLNAPLTVALLDLDHLETFNRSHGHQAGDRLLREAAAAWTSRLGPGQVLARYGGDEFALLCPGVWADDVRPLLDTLRTATPGGQTVSVGVATWDPLSEPDTVVAIASQFATEAKRAGRNQVHVAPRPTSRTLLPRPTMLWQPIVDLQTTRPVGVEALSRFAGEDAQSVFDTAASVGSGPTLEAVAISYAITNRPEGLWVAVNVSLEALGSVQVQRALGGNLKGVVLEITEHPGAAVHDVTALLRDYRARGASVAVDDWGPGFSNIDRFVTLRPDIVKVDLSRLASLDAEHVRAGIRLVTGWAETVGAMVCAEGVETEETWRQVCDLGIQLGQGHFFGRPMPPAELLELPRDTVPPRLAPVLAPRRLR